MAEDIDENDQFVSDEELAEEMDIPEPPKSPSLDKCGICPFRLSSGDPDEPLIRLKRRKALLNCNKWAKRRKMDITFEVRIS